MNKETFEKLDKSFESGELVPARVTICELPEKNMHKARASPVPYEK